MRINMSKEKPMGIAAKVPRVRYSAAYPTRAERGLRRGNYCVTLTVSEGPDPKNTQEVCVGGLKLFALRHLKAFRK